MHDLNRYAIQETIGSGGFADVFRAIDIVTHRSVALKKSRAAPDCIARTKREIEVQRLLLHGNVMPILDWSEDGSWFVMPRAAGDIGALRERRPIEGAGLLRLVEDIAAALGAAHRRGLVHRDLSPANVLWLEDRWIVADWGFVRLPPGQPRTQLTRSGVGTECFTAPEVYRDGSTSAWRVGGHHRTAVTPLLAHNAVDVLRRPRRSRSGELASTRSGHGRADARAGSRG